ncbi:MAG: GEVED domain-containing protein, partial [Planktomarina sp.]
MHDLPKPNRISKSLTAVATLTYGLLICAPFAQAGDFARDLATETWPEGTLGPRTTTLTDQYGFETDVVTEFSGPVKSVSGKATPYISSTVGSNRTGFALAGDAIPGAADVGEDTIVTKLDIKSAGQALPVDGLEYEIYDIDAKDQNATDDNCDYVTVSGVPAVTPTSPTPTFSTSLGTLSDGSSGLTSQIQCQYNPLLDNAPSSINSTLGTAKVRHPDGTSAVRIEYDEAIDKVRPTATDTNDPSVRSIGVLGDMKYKVDQVISMDVQSDQVGIADEGDVISYAYVVKNEGPLAIKTTQDIDVESDTIPVINCPTVTTDIPVGGTATCTGTYTVTAADVLAKSVTNTSRAGVGKVSQSFTDRLLSKQKSDTVITDRGVDRGDAPVSFLQATHTIVKVPTIYMGVNPPDRDLLPQNGTTATGDDLAGVDDEDGVVIPQMTQGVLSTIVVTVEGPGYLSAWADFDGGGLFVDGTIEQIADDLRDDGLGSDVAAGDGQIEVTVLVPETSLVAQSYARFRWSSQAGLDPNGPAPDGEVEDYTFVVLAPDIQDRGDAPASYGDPSHYIVDSIYLGATPPDNEALPLYSSDARGDDDAGSDDEDDIVFSQPLTAGQTSTITVETHETLGLLLDQPIPPVGLVGVTYLQAFIDFDNNGQFTNDEHVAVNYLDGSTGDVDNSFNNSISFIVNVPDAALGGPTFMRLRWSTTSGISSNPFEGQSLDGEVSDFLIDVEPKSTVIGGTVFIDNGSSAHDGLKGPDEVGTDRATVQIFDAASQSIGFADLEADGTWQFELPQSTIGPVSIQITAEDGFLIVSENTDAVTLAAPNNQIDGFVTIDPETSTSFDVGIVDRPRFSQDQVMQSGSNVPVLLRHVYVASTNGTVSFATQNTQPASSANSITLFSDPNCDGQAGSVLSGSTPVARSQTVCIVARVVSSNEVNFDIVATTTLDNTTIIDERLNTDLVRIMDTSGHLRLSKTVRNATAGTGENATNQGQIGDVLVYEIYMVNEGPYQIADVVVHDKTPPYTALAAPAPSPITLADGQTCDLSVPTNNVT